MEVFTTALAAIRAQATVPSSRAARLSRAGFADSFAFGLASASCTAWERRGRYEGVMEGASESERERERGGLGGVRHNVSEFLNKCALSPLFECAKGHVQVPDWTANPAQIESRTRRARALLICRHSTRSRYKNLQKRKIYIILHCLSYFQRRLHSCYISTHLCSVDCLCGIKPVGLHADADEDDEVRESKWGLG